MRKALSELSVLKVCVASCLVLTAIGCARTDQAVYIAGEPGKGIFSNPGEHPLAQLAGHPRSFSLFLPGCAPFVTERSLDGIWIDLGPPFVCIWEGIAVEVEPGESVVTPFQAPTESGVYRHRYDFGIHCEPDLPLSQAECKSMSVAVTHPFEVERELCEPDEFGCQFVPAAPNFLCDDGIHVGGPAGECTRDPSTGDCGYEFLSCP